MNKVFLSAFRKGLLSGRRGEPESVCPYNAFDMCRGVPTWSLAFYRHWIDGYRWGVAGCDCSNPCPGPGWEREMSWQYSDTCLIHKETLL